MLIRKAILSDAKAIAEIYKFDLGYETDINSIGKKLYVYSLVHYMDENQREAIFVAELENELENEVVGVIHIEKFETLYYKPIANVLSLAVKEKYHRKGIGKALMDEATEWAKKNELDEIRLESACHRKEAHEFYRAIGFDNEKNQIRFLKKLT